jgi:hypothetical protein
VGHVGAKRCDWRGAALERGQDPVIFVSYTRAAKVHAGGSRERPRRDALTHRSVG